MLLGRVFSLGVRFEFEQPVAAAHTSAGTSSPPPPPQVAKAFVRLRNGLPAVTPDRAAAYAAAAARQYHSFRGLPEEAWPLFLSAKQYLHMLDGEAAARLPVQGEGAGACHSRLLGGVAQPGHHMPCLAGALAKADGASPGPLAGQLGGCITP